MGTFVGSIGMIRHPDFPEQKWLGSWNPSAGQFSFVFAEKIGNDTFRECLDREIGWLLPLRRGRDYLISSMARIHLETELITRPGSSDAFVVELFVVDLYGKQSLASINQADELSWLTVSELIQGKTNEDLPIAPTLVQLLRKGSVFHPQYRNRES